jgi:hypothetical protein
MQSPQRSQRGQLQDCEGSAELNLVLPQRSPGQSLKTRGSTDYNLVCPQRSKKKLLSPRLSHSSPQPKKNEQSSPPWLSYSSPQHAHPLLSPQFGECRSPFRAAIMKTLMVPPFENASAERQLSKPPQFTW